MISAVVVDQTRKEGGGSEARNARLSSGVITIVSPSVGFLFREPRWQTGALGEKKGWGKQ